MNSQRGDSRARWAALLLPALLAWACTPVPPAATPSGETSAQEASVKETSAQTSSPRETPEQATSTEEASASETAPPVAPEPPAAEVATVDFATDIRPILESGCRPCHFEGGKMYGRLPFDRPETIRTLGERLFTRIKDPDEQRILRSFLEQEESAPAEGGAEDPW